MTAPVYAGPIYLGPGELKIGEVGSEIDVSCQVNGARIAASKADAADGLFALSWAEPGSQQPFTFTPSTEAGTAAAGTLILDPLDFGADAYGAALSSDFEFKISGDVTYTFPTGATAVFATGRRVRRPRIPPAAAGAPAAPAKAKAK